MKSIERAKLKEYHKIWRALIALGEAANDLRESATASRVLAMKQAKDTAVRRVEEDRILFPEELTVELENVLLKFGDFLEGKEGLIELRAHGAPQDLIDARIRANGSLRNEYRGLLLDSAGVISGQIGARAA